LAILKQRFANEIADYGEGTYYLRMSNAVINWDKTSEEKVTALIEVKVTPQRGLGFDSIAERLYKYDEVTSVYLIRQEALTLLLL